MDLTLKNFKQAIPATILTRGREYYRSGRVVDLSLDGDDAWLVEVQGSESYQVAIVKQPDGSLDCTCTCPYEFGEHCKHVAAALYAIEEAFPEYFAGARRKPATKRATRMDRLREALQAAPPERLVSTLLALAEGDREMQAQLLLLLGAAGRPADVRALVKAAVRPPSGSHGFLGYWNTAIAGRKVGGIVDRADRLPETQTAEALTIYQVVLEETMAALKNCDDSQGLLSANIERALDGLFQCADRLAPQGRAALFDYCLQEATGPQHEGWDMRWRLLQIAASLVETPTQRDTLDDVLRPFEMTGKQKGLAMSWAEAWNAEQATLVKLGLIERLDGIAAAMTYVADNLHLTRLRIFLIQHHLAAGNLNEAETLAEEGLAQVANDPHRRGIAMDYRELLLAIARQRNDRGQIIKQARSLWLSRGAVEHYDLMVAAVPPDEWATFRTRLLSEPRLSPAMVAWAYAREGMWPQVRDIVFASPGFFAPYQLEMEARYPDETAKLYERLARKMLKDVSNRPTYQEAAGFLARMQELGHGDAGKAVARALIEQHPQRRAMIEELRRVL